MFKSLDHIAIVVHDTNVALRFFRDKLGLPYLFEEVLDEQGVCLTHLDLGGHHLQLVQPLIDDHPLHDFLREHGEGLHHVCFRVESVSDAIERLSDHGMASLDPKPRRGPLGRQAAFIDPNTTRGVRIEITSEPAQIDC